MLCICGHLATLSPATAVCPDACSVALQSSLAPTQARCCSDAHLPKKASTKISTRSRRGATAPAPRPRSALPRSPRGPPVQARPKSSPPERAPRPPQGPDADDKKWPRRPRNRYGSAAAPPSASRRKLAPRSRGAPRDHAPSPTALGTRKNAPSSSSRRPGSRMPINHVYRDYERYQGRRRKVEQGCESLSTGNDELPSRLTSRPCSDSSCWHHVS